LNKIINICFFFLCFYHVANGQQDTSVITMDKLGKADFLVKEIDNSSVVTSASRNAKNLENLPFTAYVITKEVIAQRGYQTIVDIIKDLPGTRVSQPGSAVHGETFSLRGLFGNYYTKILLDNVPIQPSATNGMPIGAQFPIQSIERVEVIYGPASDVYGADAMAGVINIITKKSDKIKWGNASLIMGNPYLSGVKFTAGGKFGKANRVYNYTMYGGYRQFRDKNITEGYGDVYNPQNYAPTGDTSYLSNPNYEGTLTAPSFNGLPSSSAHAGLRLSGKRITLGFDGMLRNEHSAIGLNPLYSTYHNPNTKMGERIFRGYGAYEAKIKNWNSRTYISWLSYQMDRGSSYGTVENPLGLEGTFYSYAASDDLYFEETVNHGWTNGIDFQAGVTFQYSGNFPNFNYLTEPFDPNDYAPWANSIKNNPILEELGITPFNFTNTSVMAQVYYDKRKWEGMFGVRYDFNSKFGSAINPRLGVSYKLQEKMVLRGSISTAFRPPSSYLIYNSLEVDFTDTSFFPSPQFNLKPEVLTSVEIGWKWLISKSSTFDVAFYTHQTDNHIVKSFSAESNRLFYGYQNSLNSKSGLSGIQLQYSFRDLGSMRWYSDLSVNFAEGYEELPFSRGRINDYREMPNWIGKWLVGFYPIKSLHVGVRNQVSSSWLSSTIINSELSENYRVDGYYTLDVLVNYSVSDKIRLLANFFNVNDAKYGGISAVNDVGFLRGNGSEPFTESLYLNPQYGARFTLGVDISL
jgi:outer membrane cobalamin receptor